MQQRRITLEDGRYLIFYTFDDEGGASSASTKARGEVEREKKVEPQAKPQAEEERSV